MLSEEELLAMNKLYLEEDNKAFRDALKKMLMKYHTYKLEAGDYDNMFPALKSVREYINEVEDGKWPEWVFVTVNPKPDVALQDIINKVTKCVNKKWISKYAYTYEQRSETLSEIYGIHVHILMRRGDKKPCQMIKEISNTFKDICLVSSSSCLNIKRCPDDHIIRRYKYITDMKSDEQKHKKQEVDRQWRKQVGLKDIYTNDEKFFSDLLDKYNNATEKETSEQEETYRLQEKWDSEDYEEFAEFNQECVTGTTGN